MAVLKLTDLAIKTLPEGVYFDEKTPGFGLLVGKRRKTWLVVKGTGRVRVRIGHYPTLSLADARRKAMVALGSTDELRTSTPFLEVRDAFLETHGAKLRPLSRYQLNRTVKGYFTWTKALQKITHEDVALVIDGIKAESEAAHALKDIKTFFNWCIPRYIDKNPALGIKASPYKPRERVLADAELRRVWERAIEIGFPYGNIVQLCIITGQRIGEICALRRSWISDELTIPAEVAKNGREHVIPIGTLTAELLKSLPNKGDLLFAARGVDKPFTGTGSNKKMLDKCGVANFTHHDLRRTFATNLARLGTRLEVTERLLNHVSGSQSGIVGVYQRYDFKPEMKEAVLKHEQFLLSLFLADKTSAPRGPLIKDHGNDAPSEALHLQGAE
jgi:integrase